MELIEWLKNSLYVNDLVTGEANDNEVLDLYLKSKSIMQQGGFNLRKWNTNSTVVLEAINRSTEGVTSLSVSDGMKSVTEEDESYVKATTAPPIKDDKTADSNIVKVLGSIWNTATDELSPFTMQWKVLFQVLCNERTDWDEQLSDEHLKKWNSLIAELQTLNSVRILRCYFDSHSASLLKSAQLHCFSDASERVYTAVIYLPLLYEDGHVEVNLIALKTKIALLKKQNIPRLELLGATILARLAKTVQNALPQKLETVYWVDSMTVLCWISNTMP